MNRVTVRAMSAVAVLSGMVAVLVLSLQIGGGAADEDLRGRHPAAPPFVLFRALAPAEVHGRVGLFRLDPSAASRQMTDLVCSRVHYAGGRGVCIVADDTSSEATYYGYVFDRSFTRGVRIVLPGAPTRVRVTPNGRVAAITTYAEQERPEGERLGTTTQVYDLRSGHALADFRDFTLRNEGFAPSPDPVDVTSVAFERDSDRFFATVLNDGERYLASGSLSERRLDLLRSGVASEGLSPDGHRLAVKRLVGDRGFWQVSVVDLRTWTDRDLMQGGRSIDDQIDWLDNDHVMYHDADGDTTSLWMLPVDGINAPRVFIKDADSGAVQR